jgi:hypothetical protein
MGPQLTLDQARCLLARPDVRAALHIVSYHRLTRSSGRPLVSTAAIGTGRLRALLERLDARICAAQSERAYD